VVVVKIASVAMAVIALVAFATGAAAVEVAGSVTCDGQWQVIPTFDHSTQSGEIDTLSSVAARSSSDQWAVGSWTKYPEDYHFHPLV
jgi:hypothetical protein